MSTRFEFLLAFGLLAIAAISPSLADTYTCQPVDIPGGTFTQVWQINDADQIAAGSSLGGYVYDSGTGRWTLLPAPPAASGYTSTDLGALGINNFGEIVGVAQTGTSPQQGFLLSSLTGGAYTFPLRFASPALPMYTGTEFRGVGASGLITGDALVPNPVVAQTSVGVVYNPTAHAITNFPPGYTVVQPVMSDGSNPVLTILQGINGSGLFVGSGRSPGLGTQSFIFNPSTRTMYRFVAGNGGSAARAINDGDPNSSTNCAARDCVRVAGFTSGNTPTDDGFYVDFDPASGQVQTPHVMDCVSQIPGAVSAVFEGINNRDIITGIWNDTSGNAHGLIAYPNVVLPTAVIDGAFTFSVTVAGNLSVFLDPPNAVGYAYAAAEGNPNFGSVTLPIGVGGDQYTLLARGHAFPLPAGKRFDFALNGFANGVRGFTVEGISPSAALSPTNPTAFVTEVTFKTNGQFTGSMTPLDAADEISRLLRAVDDSPSPLEDDMERVSSDYGRSDLAGACAALGRFIADVQALAAHTISETYANYLTSQANAIAGAIGCI